MAPAMSPDDESSSEDETPIHKNNTSGSQLTQRRNNNKNVSNSSDKLAGTGSGTVGNAKKAIQPIGGGFKNIKQNNYDSEGGSTTAGAYSSGSGTSSETSSYSSGEVMYKRRSERTLQQKNQESLATQTSTMMKKNVSDRTLTSHIDAQCNDLWGQRVWHYMFYSQPISETEALMQERARQQRHTM